MNNNFGDDRRKYRRIAKNFILTYYLKDDPTRKFEITQLKNISSGGLCFVTSKSFSKGDRLGVELKTPFITEKTHIDCLVLESHQKIVGMIYETRVEFEYLNDETEFLLKKLNEIFVEGE